MGSVLVPELELVESVCKLALVEPVCDPPGSDSFESFFFSLAVGILDAFLTACQGNFNYNCSFPRAIVVWRHTVVVVVW